MIRRCNILHPQRRAGHRAHAGAILGPIPREEKSELGDRIEFDIPTQSFGSALSAYGVATRIQLFVDTELAAGRRSTALKGVFSFEEALKDLLAGTGLEPRAIGTFALRRITGAL
jgi:hypothetical protein